MATLRFSVLKGRQTAKKTFVVYLAVTHKRTVRYISTEYEIDDLYQFEKGKVVCRKDSKIMNQRLGYLLAEYKEKLNDIPNIKAYTCSQIKEILEGKHKLEQFNSLIDCMRHRIEGFRKEGRDSYADMNQYTLDLVKSILGDIALKSISPATIDKFRKGISHFRNATIQMKLSHLKACINDAIRDGLVQYEIHPFAYTKMPKSPPRQLDLTIDEFVKIRDFETDSKKMSLGKDVFLLSFYLGGINLIDLVDADFSNATFSYQRRKTRNKKQGEKVTTFSMPEHAAAIAKKYINNDGKLDFGYKLTYSNFQMYVNNCIKLLAKQLNIKSNISYYSARKTFAQYAFDLGIRTEIVEYCIGQSMKENRPIYNYVRIMQRRADAAMRRVIDYTDNPDKYEFEIDYLV